MHGVMETRDLGIPYLGLDLWSVLGLGIRSRVRNKVQCEGYPTITLSLTLTLDLIPYPNPYLGLGLGIRSRVRLRVI